MAAVLTVNSSLTCPHQGKLSLSAASNVLTVGGDAVVTMTDLATATISGCTVVTDLSHGLKQCLMVASVLAGSSKTLTVGGTPVALDTAQGFTDGLSPAGPVQWQVQTAGQTSMTAN